MTYLVTGGAGFIGSTLVDALLRRGERVVCLDNFTSYYTPARKRRNIAWAAAQPGYTLAEADLRDAEALEDVFATHRPSRVVHLAAMPGPRPSIADPALYEAVNVGGSVRMLDLARRYEVESFVLASTSSVYGKAERLPFEEVDRTDRPLSPYAATKKAAEVLAYTFHSLYGMPVNVVRFFTVYGPRGRPDMTPYLFVDKMVRGEPFVLFNGGVELFRDYTYVDDIVAGVMAAVDRPLGYEIFNLGNAQPVEMRHFVGLLEQITGRAATIESRPLPATEPPITFASTEKAQRLLGFAPTTSVEAGLARFWEWYQAEVLPA
ncbi:GDP-mannose 4,6-dehydratase [Oscillochloris sp. ZM17-4]|uniref:NAD-dependent epimerase/dehydratase family protein n=1 Tax=Oscillochloris sp. ZM17-4 TaxID=2866714 RepID=UPI001C72C084|nr:NAD-dependent epimerase/dehydratase family protein [Oscillochloris sp. ZM17-4]MBX0329076.1 GDP-mannose 4,6-dehydratase [Oscillochloris sp. ZM17-4]